MNDVTKELLRTVSELDGLPKGAYNIRENGHCASRNCTEKINIVSKTDKPGIDIIVKPGTKYETVYIPAIVTESDVDDLVYNDFYIGEDADITIVAGCGVHTDGTGNSQHNGIHRFFLRKNSRVLYLEKHIGTGEGTGERIINPETYMELGENSYMEMDTLQIKGVDSSKRVTEGTLAANAKLIIREKIMTHGNQTAETIFKVDLNGNKSGADVISRSVARDSSKQIFRSTINGNADCSGHTECDAIIMDNGVVSAIPELTANHVDAALIHEAAIGKIAGEQLTKLMTLGLSEAEGEAKIIEGFLK
ncbi:MULTISPECIES: SufB/SufD family protein [Anaerosinus]|uniref:SufD family Fe-S cluster assembly protein n=1 Tax=Selenobaculum gibii TaxID=3054208 RepID=A0A9Y2AJU7_9FIRM|nr:SufD family Fe-S cluster assembly protein [Selenobaculum gbiensis]WIW71227.1 SufD family Fe-S cluster assembly protein [Selenobaculum gbiensis]